VAALIGGLSDIAAASRTFTVNEQELARARNVQCNDYVIGFYSIAIVVNAGNSIGNLTRDQVRDIFTGVIQNWKEVGGPDTPIHLYIRDPISGTHLGFRELAMENKPYGADMKPFTSYEAIVEAVGNDASGIGYSSLELLTKPSVKAVSIGGIAPTAAAVNQGQYPYARVLHLFTDKAKEPPTAHDFIQFVQSSAGQQVLNQMGFVPRS
jgi:phosphate transport system substrate-binding protein